MNNLQPITREEMFLADIAEASQGGGGGSGLPAVTSDDNGDVLTVVEGSWAKAQPSGGGAFVVNFSLTDETYSADKTFAEIIAAFDSGLPVEGHVIFDDEQGYYGALYLLNYVSRSGSTGEAVFYNLAFEAGYSAGKVDIMVNTLTVNYDNSVTFADGKCESN